MLNIHHGSIGRAYSLQHLLSIHPGVNQLTFMRNADLASVQGFKPTASYPPVLSDNRDAGYFEFLPTPGLVASLARSGIEPEINGYYLVYHLDDSIKPDRHQAAADLIADRYPKAASRALRAAEIARSGHVIQAEQRPHTYYVKSFTSPERTYEVHIPPGNREHWTCFTVQDPETRHAHLPCQDIQHRAPFLKNGKRCKHMLAAWMYEHLGRAPNLPSALITSERGETPATPLVAEVSPEHSSTTAEPTSVADSNYTTPGPFPINPRTLVSRYADGRPAKLANGAVIRYTAGGHAIEIPGTVRHIPFPL